MGEDYSEKDAAVAYGRDAWAHGVSIDGARAYSDRTQVQEWWRQGWMMAENEQRQRRGETPSGWFFGP